MHTGGCGINVNQLPPPMTGGLTEYLCIIEQTPNGWADIIKYELVDNCKPRAWVIWSKDLQTLEHKKNRFLKYVPHALITETLSVSKQEIQHLGLLEHLKKHQRTYLSHKCYGCPKTFTTRISRLGMFENANPKPWLRPDYPGKVDPIKPNFYCEPCLGRYTTTGKGLYFCLCLAPMASAVSTQYDCSRRRLPDNFFVCGLRRWPAR